MWCHIRLYTSSCWLSKPCNLSGLWYFGSYSKRSRRCTRSWDEDHKNCKEFARSLNKMTDGTCTSSLPFMSPLDVIGSVHLLPASALTKLNSSSITCAAYARHFMFCCQFNWQINTRQTDFYFVTACASASACLQLPLHHLRPSSVASLLECDAYIILSGYLAKYACLYDLARLTS